MIVTMQNEYSFRIKFEKDQPSINAETYVQSLISLTTMIREVNYQSGTAPAVSVNVLAQEPGSFDVALQVIQTAAENPGLVLEAANFLNGVVMTVISVIGLKKASQNADFSQTEVHGDQVNIKDVNGNVIYQANQTVYNIFTTNQAVNDAVSNQFQAIKQDPEMEAVTITADDSVVSFGREDFDVLSERRIIEIEEHEIVVVPTQLTISKIVLDSRERKWDFIYQGVKISARIVDEGFLDRVQAGDIRFANGDILVADLKIIRELDANLNVYLNKDYAVESVRQHLPRTNRIQTSIEDIEPPQI